MEFPVLIGELQFDPSTQPWSETPSYRFVDAGNWKVFRSALGFTREFYAPVANLAAFMWHPSWEAAPSARTSAEQSVSFPASAFHLSSATVCVKFLISLLLPKNQEPEAEAEPWTAQGFESIKQDMNSMQAVCWKRVESETGVLMLQLSSFCLVNSG